MQGLRVVTGCVFILLTCGFASVISLHGDRLPVRTVISELRDNSHAENPTAHDGATLLDIVCDRAHAA